MIPIELISFNARADRTHFVARRFAKYFTEKVLDVGCYEAPLRALLPPGRYVGVDMAGSPDIVLNLDAAERLPFADNEIPTVISIETLEHLEHLHRLFGELVRVSANYVIVSLPNCWRDARRPIERGRGEFAHYGLPVEPPLDRHRWFFSFSQGQHFLTTMARKHDLKIVELFGTEPPRNFLVRLLRRLRYRPDAYANRYVQTIWIVLAKQTVAVGKNISDAIR